MYHEQETRKQTIEVLNMGILGSEISGIWVDECGWSNSPAQYKSRDHNRIMVVILTEIERKGFRYMSFDINFEGAIKDMIERKFITCCNLHTKATLLKYFPNYTRWKRFHERMEELQCPLTQDSCCLC